MKNGLCMVMSCFAFHCRANLIAWELVLKDLWFYSENYPEVTSYHVDIDDLWNLANSHSVHPFDHMKRCVHSYKNARNWAPKILVHILKNKVKDTKGQLFQLNNTDCVSIGSSMFSYLSHRRVRSSLRCSYNLRWHGCMFLRCHKCTDVHSSFHTNLLHMLHVIWWNNTF